MNTLIELFYAMVIVGTIGDEDCIFNHGYQVFDYEAVNDLPTIYSKNGVVLKVCHDCGYFEILGLNNKDFSKIKKVYEDFINLITSDLEQKEIDKAYYELKERLY